MDFHIAPINNTPTISLQRLRCSLFLPRLRLVVLHDRLDGIAGRLGTHFDTHHAGRTNTQ